MHILISSCQDFIIGDKGFLLSWKKVLKVYWQSFWLSFCPALPLLRSEKLQRFWWVLEKVPTTLNPPPRLSIIGFIIDRTLLVSLPIHKKLSIKRLWVCSLTTQVAIWSNFQLFPLVIFNISETLNWFCKTFPFVDASITYIVYVLQA